MDRLGKNNCKNGFPNRLQKNWPNKCSFSAQALKLCSVLLTMSGGPDTFKLL